MDWITKWTYQTSLVFRTFCYLVPLAVEVEEPQVRHPVLVAAVVGEEEAPVLVPLAQAVAVEEVAPVLVPPAQAVAVEEVDLAHLVVQAEVLAPRVLPVQVPQAS